MFRPGRVGVADAQNLPRSWRKIPLYVAAPSMRTQIDDVADISVLVPGNRRPIAQYAPDGVMENPVSIEAVLYAKSRMGARPLPGDPGSGAPLRSG